MAPKDIGYTTASRLTTPTPSRTRGSYGCRDCPSYFEVNLAPILIASRHQRAYRTDRRERQVQLEGVGSRTNADSPIARFGVWRMLDLVHSLNSCRPSYPDEGFKFTVPALLFDTRQSDGLGRTIYYVYVFQLRNLQSFDQTTVELNRIKLRVPKWVVRVYFAV